MAGTVTEWLGLMPSWTRTIPPAFKCIRVATRESITLTTYPWLNPGTFFFLEEVDGSGEKPAKRYKVGDTIKINAILSLTLPIGLTISLTFTLFQKCLFVSGVDQYWFVFKAIGTKRLSKYWPGR